MTDERPEDDGPALGSTTRAADAVPSGDDGARASIAKASTQRIDGATVPGDGAVAGAETAGDAATPAVDRSGIHVRFAGRTAVGLVREHNEDNFVVANLTSGERHARDRTLDDRVGEAGLMFAVCDGMGGAAAGEVASQMAVDILYEALRRGGPPSDRDTLARRLVAAVEEAGKRIYEAAQRERSRRGMGTTATVAVLVDKVLFLAEVGDSRAYLLRRGELKQVTKDQSLVNQLIEAGHLTEAEAEAFEHSNIILQALGTAETVQVDLTFVELREGDRVLMCSDGLSGLVHAEVLREALQSIPDPADACAKLIEFAEGGGGHDNITVVVAAFDGSDLEPARETDTFGYVQYPLPLAADESGAFTDEDTTSSDAAPGAKPQPVPAAIEAVEGPSPAVWLAGGGVALLAAAAVWFMVESGRPVPAPTPPEGESQAHPVEPRAPARDEREEQAPREVTIQVYTDVEGAVLFIDDEDRGPLSVTGSRTLGLAPGVHRLEAKFEGNTVVDAVVEAKADMPPVDVFLRMPSGASDEVGVPDEESDEEDEADLEAEAGAQAPAPAKVAKTPEPAEPTEALAPAKPVVPPPEREVVRTPAPPAPASTTRPATAPAPAPAPAPKVAVEPSEEAPAAVAAPKPASKPKPPPVVEATPSEPAPAPAPPPPPKDIPDNPF